MIKKRKINLFTLILWIGFSLVIGLNMIFSFSTQTALQLLLCLSVILLPAGVFLFFGRLLPKSFFDAEKKWFQITKFQEFVCKVTNVKKWKDSIPVGGHVARFRLNKLRSPKNIEFYNRYLMESCFSDALHSTCFFWSFLALIFLPFDLYLKMSLPIALLFAYANIVPAIIQWETRPRILKLREMLLKRQNIREQTVEYCEEEGKEQNRNEI